MLEKPITAPSSPFSPQDQAPRVSFQPLWHLHTPELEQGQSSGIYLH